MFTRLHERALSLGPARAMLAAFILGAAAVLAHPPFHLLPVMIVSLTGLVWLLDGAAARPRPGLAGARVAWAFATGYFAAGLWWVANAFIARGPSFYPLIPFAVTLLPAGLALFWAVAGAVYSRLRREGPLRIALFASLFFLVEYVRGHVLSGFPWQLPGVIWPAGSPIAQSAAWFGLYGLSLLTLFAFAAPAALAGPGGRARGLPTAIGFTVFAVLFGAGLGRLGAAEPPGPDFTIRVVQAAVPQNEKWRAENRGEVRRRYLELTASPGLEDADLVVWPESALPVLLLEDGATLTELTELFGDRTALATGAYRRAPAGEGYRNALAVLDFSGGVPRLAGLYDKARLVPFGEFLPGGAVLSRLGVRLPNAVASGFEPGPGPATLETPLAPPFAPLICYEVIFPRFILRGADRPAWMLNVSNDSWFGDSAGPRQHFAQSRYRAIEEGLPLVRGASGGISGVVDARGRVRGSLAPDRPGVINLSLPAPAAPTFYSRHGDLAALLLAATLAIVALLLPASLPGIGLTRRDK